MGSLEKGSEQFALSRFPAPFNALEGYEMAQIPLAGNNGNYTPLKDFSQMKAGKKKKEGRDGARRTEGGRLES
jgi:hypothetical protein